MSDDQPPKPPAEEPPQLQSNPTPVTTETRPAPQSSYLAQLFLGFVSFWLLLVGTIGLVIFASLVTQEPANAALVLAVSLVPIGLGVCIWVWRHKHGRGLGVGFLIGLGLLALAAGICFSIFK